MSVAELAVAVHEEEQPSLVALQGSAGIAGMYAGVHHRETAPGERAAGRDTPKVAQLSDANPVSPRVCSARYY